MPKCQGDNTMQTKVRLSPKEAEHARRLAKATGYTNAFVYENIARVKLGASPRDATPDDVRGEPESDDAPGKSG